MNKFCEHRKIEKFNEYFNLWYCPSCNTYWTPVSETKNRVTFAITDVDFSRNDGRIINVWCQELIDKYRKSKQYEKDRRWEYTVHKGMYPKSKK